MGFPSSSSTSVQEHSSHRRQPLALIALGEVGVECRAAATDLVQCLLGFFVLAPSRYGG